jgi:hypothetical protein
VQSVESQMNGCLGPFWPSVCTSTSAVSIILIDKGLHGRARRSFRINE